MRRRSLRSVLVGSLAAFAAALSVLSWQVAAGQDPALRARAATVPGSSQAGQDMAAITTRTS